MVRLLEFEAKEILKQYNLPIPEQFCLAEIDNNAIYPIILKSQVPIGGRGKLGGIKIAYNSSDAKKQLDELQSLKLGGYLPKAILIEKKLPILKEYYCGFILDRNEKVFKFIFSEAGGIDIEEVWVCSRKSFIVESFMPFNQDLDILTIQLLNHTRLQGTIRDQLKPILSHCLEIILTYDVELLEINPLIETHDHQLIIADARMNMDDNALYRHADYKRNLEYYMTPLELKAREFNMSYVELEGEIGVICNGAGLVMGTIDTIQSHGKKAANFLDVGGGADAERMYQALKIITSNEKVKYILINIMGGITRCDEIAKGLIQFLKENKSILFSLRLIGTNEEAGQELLKPYNIKIHQELNDAIQTILNPK